MQLQCIWLQCWSFSYICKPPWFNLACTVRWYRPQRYAYVGGLLFGQTCARARRCSQVNANLIISDSTAMKFTLPLEHVFSCLSTVSSCSWLNIYPYPFLSSKLLMLGVRIRMISENLRQDLENGKFDHQPTTKDLAKFLLEQLDTLTVILLQHSGKFFASYL